MIWRECPGFLNDSLTEKSIEVDYPSKSSYLNQYSRSLAFGTVGSFALLINGVTVAAAAASGLDGVISLAPPIDCFKCYPIEEPGF